MISATATCSPVIVGTLVVIDNHEDTDKGNEENIERVKERFI